MSTQRTAGWPDLTAHPLWHAAPVARAPTGTTGPPPSRARRAFGLDFTCIRQEMRHSVDSGRMGHAIGGLAHRILGRSRPASLWTCLQPQRGTEFTRSARGQSSMSAAACSHCGRCWVCAVGAKGTCLAVAARNAPQKGWCHEQATVWWVSVHHRPGHGGAGGHGFGQQATQNRRAGSSVGAEDQ